MLSKTNDFGEFSQRIINFKSRWGLRIVAQWVKNLMPVAQVAAEAWVLPPGLGTSICCGCGKKQTNNKQTIHLGPTELCRIHLRVNSHFLRWRDCGF